jgi:predicted ATPase
VLEQHAALIRDAVREAGGVEVSTEGDAFFCVFTHAPSALTAAAAIQRALATHPWPDGTAVLVRIGLHTGEGILGGDNYVGLDVHRAARIASAGHGGQIVFSQAFRSLSEHALPPDAAVRDLGQHRLKDLDQPERLYELLVDGLPQDFPPLRTLEPLLHNLPIQLTSFLGREEEIAEVCRVLSDARLVTLTGPGGTGKTRLAIEAARSWAGRLADGVWFVPLASIDDPDLLGSAVIDTLGIRYAAGGPLDQIVQHFADRDALLVLDNFEQVLPAAPALADLLRQCPSLRLLVTSRAALRISGEQEVPVAPLAAPTTGPAPSDPAVVCTFAAAQLFVERARAARPDFSLTSENAADVAGIARRLDGLPLAIELAAALVKLLPPRSISARLERSLDVLKGGPQDLPERQRSLRGAIAWSYELLDERARLLLEHLSVFAGGASYEMVEEVCAPDDPDQLLDALRTLVDQSLVVQADDGDMPRFSMLESIRDFAREQLEARGLAEDVRGRHAAAFLALVGEAEHAIFGPDEVRWAATLDREYDNLRAAATWGAERGDLDIALGIPGRLMRWAMYRFREEVFAWAETAISLPGAAAHPHYAPASAVAAEGRVMVGDFARALVMAEQGLAAAPDPSDPARFQPLEILFYVALFEGRLDDGRAVLEQIEPLIRDEPWRRAFLDYNRSLLATYGNDPARGVELARAAQSAARAVRNPLMLALTVYAEGEALMPTEPEQALAALDEAIAIARSVDARFVEGVAGVSAISLRARYGDARGALCEFRDLVEQWRRAQHWTQLWTTMRTVAEALVRAGSLEAAAVLVGAIVDAERGAPAFGDDAARLAAVAARAEEELGPDRAAAARARGRAMGDDEVIAFVREEIDRIPEPEEDEPAPATGT